MGSLLRLNKEGFAYEYAGKPHWTTFDPEYVIDHVDMQLCAKITKKTWNFIIDEGHDYIFRHCYLGTFGADYIFTQMPKVGDARIDEAIHATKWGGPHVHMQYVWLNLLESVGFMKFDYELWDDIKHHLLITDETGWIMANGRKWEPMGMKPR